MVYDAVIQTASLGELIKNLRAIAFNALCTINSNPAQGGGSRHGP
jgi:hypothetical protein